MHRYDTPSILRHVNNGPLTALLSTVRNMTKQALPEIPLIHHLTRRLILAHQLRQRRVLHLQRIRLLQTGIEQLGRRLLGLALLPLVAHVLHAALDAEVVDALLDGARRDVQPDGCLVLLADAVDARDGL